MGRGRARGGGIDAISLTIHPLDLGTVEIDTSFPVWSRTPGTRTTIAVIGYLILGGPAPIVVDTGARFGQFTKGQHVFHRGPDQSLAATLERVGVDPADVGTLILTHLHSDHTGELDALPGARIAVQRRELQYAAAPYFPVTLYDREAIGQLVTPLFDRVDLLEGDLEIAPGVRCVWTGGHSPGHQQVEVQLASGLAIITGDTAYWIDSVAEQVAPGYVTSIPETMRALADIRRRADHVLPMHDPRVHERYGGGLS